MNWILWFHLQLVAYKRHAANRFRYTVVYTLTTMMVACPPGCIQLKEHDDCYSKRVLQLNLLTMHHFAASPRLLAMRWRHNTNCILCSCLILPVQVSCDRNAAKVFDYDKSFVFTLFVCVRKVEKSLPLTTMKV